MEDEKKTKYVWCMKTLNQPELIKCRLEEIKPGNLLFVKGAAVQTDSGIMSKQNGKKSKYFKGMDKQEYFVQDLMPADEYLLWNYKEYAMAPLGFFPIKQLLPEKKLGLLQAFQLWYEDTDQETEKFSLEFEVVSRMLLFEDAVIINPKYLRLSDVLEELSEYLQEEEQAVYVKAREKYFYLFGDAAQ